ncbi:hypothetical protein ACQEVB_31695 [Pseudonocardia sp. CA-107938]|uniref:hypothetical protein n=1 Tax=Pseudonocardia sp. CA-107938 TaxID=3240021 RepID=UPI003D9488DB
MARGTSRSELLGWCTAAGLAGATAGVVFVLPWQGWLSVVVGLGAAAIGALVAALVAAPEPAPPPQRSPHRPPRGPWPDPGQPARPRRVPEPAASADAARVVLPVEPAPTNWWGDGRPTDRTVAAAPVRTVTAPDLATYRRPVRTVQCPRCGAFRIDVRETDHGYAFRCRADDHTWTWQAGTPWPATVVASRRRPDR